MKVVYVSPACSRYTFYELFRDLNTMPGQQVQKYHRLVMEGLVANGATVMSLALPPITRTSTSALVVAPPTDVENGVAYSYVPIVNIPVVRNLCAFAATFVRVFKGLRSSEQAVVICEALNLTASLAVLLAGRLCRRSTAAIVTDLPQFLGARRHGLRRVIVQGTMRRYDSYVLLTEHMNEVVNRKSAPYVVLEGHVDRRMGAVPNHPEEKYGKFVVLYAGAVDRMYGVETLVRGFLAADAPDMELHIYGTGNYVPELRNLCKDNVRLKYFGNVRNEKVIEEQRKATLLVNPRSARHEFTRYSFPSKNMEYLASGTPMLAARLPGMPTEYEEHMYLLESDTIAGMKSALESLYSTPRGVLHNKGAAGKEFVLSEKNHVVQSAKMLHLLATAMRRS